MSYFGRSGSGSGSGSGSERVILPGLDTGVAMAAAEKPRARISLKNCILIEVIGWFLVEVSVRR
jgi:hypothetical protein